MPLPPRRVKAASETQIQNSQSRLSSAPSSEVIVTGHINSAAARFTFESQHMERYSHSSPSKRSKCSDTVVFRLVHSSRESGKCSHALDAARVFHLSDLPPDHHLHVKFSDVSRIDISGNLVTLRLCKVPSSFLNTGSSLLECDTRITGDADVLRFVVDCGFSDHFGNTAKPATFPELCQNARRHCPKLDALFDETLAATDQTEVDVPRTPQLKRKKSLRSGSTGSGTKHRRVSGGTDAVWLKCSAVRFNLVSCPHSSSSHVSWESYFRTRVSLELREATAVSLAQHNNQLLRTSAGSPYKSPYAAATWPQELGAKPDADHPCFEVSWSASESRVALQILHDIRASAKALLTVKAPHLESTAWANGIFLLSYSLADIVSGEARAVTAVTRVYAGDSSTHFVDLMYENHKHVRCWSTEHYSHLYAALGSFETTPAKRGSPHNTLHTRHGAGSEQVFLVDVNGSSVASLSRSRCVSEEVVARIGKHLFGTSASMSEQTVLEFLAQAAGIGKFTEQSVWPLIAGQLSLA